MSSPMVEEYKKLRTKYDEYDENGVQIVFTRTVGKQAWPETRAERLTRYEKSGVYSPTCEKHYCKDLPNHPKLSIPGPGHTPSRLCRSGGRTHCTCRACF